MLNPSLRQRLHTAVLAHSEPPTGKLKPDAQKSRLNKRKVVSDSLMQAREDLFAGELEVCILYLFSRKLLVLISSVLIVVASEYDPFSILERLSPCAPRQPIRQRTSDVGCGPCTGSLHGHQEGPLSRAGAITHETISAGCKAQELERHGGPKDLRSILDSETCCRTSSSAGTVRSRCVSLLMVPHEKVSSLSQTILSAAAYEPPGDILSPRTRVDQVFATCLISRDKNNKYIFS